MGFTVLVVATCWAAHTLGIRRKGECCSVRSIATSPLRSSGNWRALDSHHGFVPIVHTALARLSLVPTAAERSNWSRNLLDRWLSS
jgi:hypothetical protein